ncbi:sigma-70 family RNA polymerase sigma factor [Methylobacillus arboreus]|uniref:sigma-70 family RNA polymerase sigma factor n=1 Tax=Methylobacillus arboreus TaxID=755170 RepID=UPI001E2B37C3|nr:sigma-70 family RNA polymerase sigma factor [Methylobacillus arboreus]MCB5189475.1 sigma-70 family RNA polymerase sigma factor [Methylobacillus arboreus]
MSRSSSHLLAEQLYTQHQGWLCQWLNRRLNNTAEAADLAQDTFMRILVMPEVSATNLEHAPLREPRAYLATVARRVLLNHFRRASLERAWLDALALMPEDQAPSPEQQALIAHALNEVDAMLNGLSPVVREVFVLSQVEGLTYAEIAQQLNIGLRSVKRYMAQAMAECIVLASSYQDDI